MGMLLLASDFIGSGRVNKAEHLERISKANITFLLSKTKSGDYLAINPFSQEPLTVKLTQLPSLSAITEFVTDRSNLDLNKLYKKLHEFETKEAEILGGFSGKELQAITKLLQAPKSSRSDFETLKPTRDQNQIKEDIKSVNQLVYDSSSLDKEIDERLDLIEKALKEEMTEYENKYKEREKYWQAEIENKNELLQKRLKEREKQLDKDIEGLEKELDKKIDHNLKQFKDGVAKNIRKDEKPIEKSIVELEKLVSSKTDRAMVDKIEQELIKLEDFTKIFQEAVGFARRQVDVVKSKERDLYEIHELETERLRQQAEEDKKELREDSKRKEKERDQEMKGLREDRDAVKQRYAKFRDLRDEWKNNLREEIGDQETAMVPQRLIPSEGNGAPTIVELSVPTYLFQYRRENEVSTLAVPPVKMPDNMKKPDRGSFYGDGKTVYYHLIVPESERLITDWFSKRAQRLELQSNIQELKNILNDSAELRNTFFDNRSFMEDKLKVNGGRLRKANNRLTDVFSA